MSPILTSTVNTVLGVLCASDHSYGRYPYNRSMPSIAFRSDDLDVPTRVVGMVLHSRLWEGRIVLGGNLIIKLSNPNLVCSFKLNCIWL